MTLQESLKWIYKNLYLSQEIKKKYLSQFNDCTILGQNFVDTTYILILEVRENYYNKTKFYVIEENIKNSKIFELKTFTASDGYIRFNQNSLKNFIEPKSFKALLKNGLFKTKKDRTYNAPISVQRLVGCLYGDITGMDMHHINKNKSDNRFMNLVPLDGDTNKRIDNLPTDEMIQFGETTHQEWVQQINKKKRNTLSENPLLILDILTHSIGKKQKDVHRQFRDKVKSIKIIRKILKTYYYKENFIFFLKHNNINIYSN